MICHGAVPGSTLANGTRSSIVAHLASIPMINPVGLRAEEFPWAAERIWLDAASIGPLPASTLAAVEAFTRARAAPHELAGVDFLGILKRSRELVARLVGAAPEDIALTPNTSYGINLAARMLPFEPGDLVLVPDGEFPANVYPWMNLADRGVGLERVPLDREGWPDEDRIVERLGDPRVRVLAVSLVQFHTGYRVDLPRLSRRCRETGTALVVDAIQGVGVVPLDLREVEVDFLACGAQKWLLSPWGSGFLYVNRVWHERLRPPFAGWTAFEGTDDFSDLTRYDPRWRPDARRFELFTLPYQDFVGMNASLEFLLGLGVDAVGRQVRVVHEPVLDWARRHGVRVASPTDHRGSGILALAVADPRQTRARLLEHGVGCSVREGLLRLSPHCYTAVEDMARVAEILGGKVGK
jgi:cysteine desulfurase/selenocysteine lyase